MLIVVIAAAAYGTLVAGLGYTWFRSHEGASTRKKTGVALILLGGTALLTNFGEEAAGRHAHAAWIAIAAGIVAGCLATELLHRRSDAGHRAQPDA